VYYSTWERMNMNAILWTVRGWVVTLLGGRMEWEVEAAECMAFSRGCELGREQGRDEVMPLARQLEIEADWR
jgi:hypothetical protein